MKGKQIEGIKFRRQEPIGQYIVDFASHDKKLVIEIDGGQHSENEVRKRDNDRTEWLEDEGYQVLRFWNDEVLTNLDGVIERIKEAIL